MHNQYLQTLGLSAGAEKTEIKKAYRKLSKQYHPDLNKSDNAKDKFIEITEAYNFLMEVGPRPHQESVNYNYNPYASEFESRRQRARKKAKQRAKEEAFRRKVTIQKVLKVTDITVLIALAFNIALVIDHLLPPIDKPTKIENAYIRKIEGEEYYVNPYFGKKSVSLENHNMVFDNVLDFRVYENATIYLSPILKVPVSIEFYVFGELKRYHQFYSVLKAFWFFNIINLILCPLYIIIRSAQAKLNLSIYMVFVFIVQLFIYLLF